MIRSLGRSAALRRRLSARSTTPLLSSAQGCAFSGAFPQHSDGEAGLDLPPPAAVPPPATGASSFVSLSATAPDESEETETLQASDDTADIRKDPHAPGFKNASQRQLERDDGEGLREATHKFVHKIQYGTFTEPMWKEAVELVEHWTKVSKMINTPESVDQSFLLLDRLVFEQETQKYPHISLFYLYNDILRKVVKNWNRCVRKFHDYSLEDQALLRYEYTPMEVLARLEDYSDRSPRMQFDTRCLNMILDGASRCCVSSNARVPNMISPRTATAFAQSLFERMDRGNRTRPEIDKEEGATPVPLKLGQHGNPNHPFPVPSTRPDVVTYSTMAYLFSNHGLAGRAETLLDRMYQQFTKTQNERFKPDVAIFTTVLLAWSRSKDPNAGERADTILRRMKELAEFGFPELEPDVIAYTAALSCWANGANVEEKRRSKQQAEQNLKGALLLFEEMKEKGKTNTRSYNIMLNVLSKAGKPLEAEGLFNMMVQKYEEGIDNIQPNTVALNTIVAAWSRVGQEKGGIRAMKFFNHYERLFTEGKVADPPNKISYNSAIHCLARSRNPDAAMQLLEKMKTVKYEHGVNIEPDRISWNSTIDAYAKAKDPRRAEALLEQMYKEFISMEGKKAHMRPDLTTFCTVLDAWRGSRDPSAAERAEAILKTMYSLNDAGVLKVAPTTIAYNIVLACWLNSEARDAPNRCEAILNIMEEEFQKGSTTVRPDAHAHDQVILAYANRFQARQAEAVLERQHQQSLPSAMGGGGNTQATTKSHAYNRVLGAYSRTLHNDAGQRAEDLYKRWQTRFEQEEVPFPPQPLSSQLVLATWGTAGTKDRNAVRSAGMKASKFLRYVSETSSTEGHPNTANHNYVLELCGRLQDGLATQQHFRWMVEQGKAHEKPDLESMHLILSALKKYIRPGAFDEMEALMQKVWADQPDVRPNLETYQHLLSCLENVPSETAARRAESLLEEMERNPDITPTGREYMQVVRIWTKVSNDEEHVFLAYKHFRNMMSLYYTGNQALKPSVNAFRTLISAFGRSQHAKKEEAIRNLQSEVTSLYGSEALNELNAPPVSGRRNQRNQQR